ncbi:hypothetical protein JCM14469_01000 [Desulfatiferula olefinivorans]
MSAYDQYPKECISRLEEMDIDFSINIYKTQSHEIINQPDDKAYTMDIKHIQIK